MRGGSSRGEWGPASGNYPAGIQVRKQSSHCDPQHQASHRRVKTVIRAPSSYHTGALLANGDDQNTTARLKGARRALPTSTRPLKSIQYHSSPQVSTACLVSKAKKVIKAGLDNPTADQCKRHGQQAGRHQAGIANAAVQSSAASETGQRNE